MPVEEAAPSAGPAVDARLPKLLEDSGVHIIRNSMPAPEIPEGAPVAFTRLESLILPALLKMNSKELDLRLRGLQEELGSDRFRWASRKEVYDFFLPDYDEVGQVSSRK